MVRIYIIRHGETEPNTRFACGGRSDVPLNETGLKQAEALCNRLTVKADAVYMSPLCRAQQTIKPYLDKNPNIPININFNLIERDFGIWENLSFRQIEELDPTRYKEWQDNYTGYTIPHGESLMKVQERVDEFLEKLCPMYDGRTVFLVTHLCTSRHLIAKLLGLSPEDSRRFTMENGHYAVIDFDNTTGYGVLKYLNI